LRRSALSGRVVELSTAPRPAGKRDFGHFGVDVPGLTP
jgi:hypothetical protein